MICAFKDSKTNSTSYVRIKPDVLNEPNIRAIEDALVSYCEACSDGEEFDFILAIKDVLDSFNLMYKFIKVFEFNV